MKLKLKLTTLGVELAQADRFPDGCPLLKAWRGVYSPQFNQVIQETFEFVEDENADGFLLPSNASFYHPKRLKEIGMMVTKQGLPSIGFDISHERRKPGWLDYIIRFSWYRSLQEPRVIISPAFLGGDGFDLMAELGIRDWQPREKEPLPSVSFCGREGGTMGLRIWKMMPKSLTRHMAANFFCATTRGIRMTCCYPLRVDAMQVLARDSRIKTDFLGRGTTRLQPTVQGNRRHQFLDNLQRNAYALCVRGADNYSWRFYEALSLGKIPILIDTDCMLPLEDEISWEQFIVRVPSTRLQELPDRLWEWHSQFSASEFCDLQRQLRLLFEQLTPAQFYPEIFGKILKGRDRICRGM
ncbi:exostosin domain-containing protein [Coleofasciculus sp. F4-SAH-05]|uniref:exostosin domain-containing protein n=1 Tax=Coleofasciculus sp. F4-SAH-05 TaxID=3069525 RepID=UPI0032FF272D